MAMPEGSMKCFKGSVNINQMRNRIRNYIDKHHYDSALFWADKLVSMTDTVEDIFWYAQTMYLTGQYHRAINLLTNKKLDKTYTSCRYLAAQCYYACKEWQEALNVLDMVDLSFNSRNTSMLNSSLSESFIETDTSTSNSNSSIPFQNCDNSISLLRGKIYEAMDNRSLAADCYKEALRQDVYCSEAFELLVSHHMLTAQEEKDLIESLSFSNQCPEDESLLLRFLYESKLKKYDCPGTVTVKIPEKLSELSENLDVVISTAERHLYNCDFRSAHEVTSKVLAKDPYNNQCLPIHIAVLVELKESNALFYMAHKLVDYYPDKSLSWFAVGCYYMLTENFIPARWYLSKATTLERAHGPSWLAYGHTFGVNKDHDQAMAAYFTASQIMRGCHLPFLYIGLEYGLTNNPKLAERFFSQALSIAPEDPFVLHEMGVIAFGNRNWDEAERCFIKALQRVQEVREDILPERWEPLLNNLGHVCRKLGKLEDALEYHKQAEILCPQTASTYSAIGYVHALMGNNSDAVHYFHKALGLRKDDTFSTTMLSNCLEALINDVPPFEGEIEEPNFPSPSKTDTGIVKLTELLDDREGDSTTDLDFTADNEQLDNSGLSIEEVEMDDCF